MSTELHVTVVEDHPDYEVLDIFKEPGTTAWFRTELAKPPEGSPLRRFCYLMSETGQPGTEDYVARIAIGWEAIPHPQVRIRNAERGWEADVDEGMADEILRLWDNGIATKFSCQASYSFEANDCYRDVVLASDEHLDTAVKLLPWAVSATKNLEGSVALSGLVERDDPNWRLIWTRNDDLPS